MVSSFDSNDYFVMDKCPKCGRKMVLHFGGENNHLNWYECDIHGRPDYADAITTFSEGFGTVYLVSDDGTADFTWANPPEENVGGNAKNNLIGSVSLRCDCLCSTIVVDKFKFGKEDQLYQISFQDSCANWGYNKLKFRIKAAWKMLTKKPVSYADIYIEDESVFARFVGELVDMVGMRQIAKADKKCHMCFDCPDGCPTENPNDPKNNTEEQ